MFPNVGFPPEIFVPSLAFYRNEDIFPPSLGLASLQFSTPFRTQNSLLIAASSTSSTHAPLYGACGERLVPSTSGVSIFSR